MAVENAETPTVLPNFDFYFVLQTAASDISNQHEMSHHNLVIIMQDCNSSNVSHQRDVPYLYNSSGKVHRSQGWAGRIKNQLVGLTKSTQVMAVMAEGGHFQSKKLFAYFEPL